MDMPLWGVCEREREREREREERREEERQRENESERQRRDITHSMKEIRRGEGMPVCQ
jgi:hypothetical protein